MYVEGGGEVKRNSMQRDSEKFILGERWGGGGVDCRNRLFIPRRKNLDAQGSFDIYQFKNRNLKQEFIEIYTG